MPGFHPVGGVGGEASPSKHPASPPKGEKEEKRERRERERERMKEKERWWGKGSMVVYK